MRGERERERRERGGGGGARERKREREHLVGVVKGVHNGRPDRPFNLLVCGDTCSAPHYDATQRDTERRTEGHTQREAERGTDRET